MGVDIHSSKGIIFTVEEFLKIVNGKNKSNVVGACHTFHQGLVDAANEHAPENSSWRSELAESFKPLSTLKNTMKISEIREIVASVVTVQGEPSEAELPKYGNCYVIDSDSVLELFDLIFDACPEAKDLPPIQEIEAWGSSRYNGWKVPLGVACVVFDSECCFKKTLSKQGKALEKLLGHCDETEWTEHSC